MKTAVVLCGGGTKGSYELGVWQALRELGIEYQIVTGTSIGSINGALMVQGDFEAADELWNTLVIDDIMEDGINLSMTIEGFYNQKGRLMPFLKKYVRNMGADTSPYNRLVEKLVDESRFFGSPVDYGLVTVMFPSLEPVEMTKDKLKPGMLKDYIIASSSVFPAFPMHKIGEQSYLDGCYYDNMPVDLAVRLGADRIIAVDLHDEPSHPKFMNRPFATYIKPSRNLGSMLDFDRKVLDANKNLGYYDAMKTFGKYLGFRYTFEKDGIREFETEIGRFIHMTALMDSQNTKTVLESWSYPSEKNTIYDVLEAEALDNRRSSAIEDYFVLGLENAGSIFGLDRERVYEFRVFAEMLRGLAAEECKLIGSNVFETKGTAGTIAALSELKIRKNRKYITVSIYEAVKNKQADALEKHGIYVVFQKELLAALMLLSLEGE